MNRSVLGLAAALLAAAPVLGQAPAYPTSATRPAAAARSRVAVMNINKVIKNYNRANQLGKQVAEDAKVYADRLNALRSAIAAEQNKMQTAKTQPEGDAMQKNVTKMTRDMQDLNAEAEKVVRQKQADVLVQIYKDIEGVVAALAASNDLDLVLSYPDAPIETEQNSPGTVIRKLQAPALMPIFYNRQSMDITEAVIQTLNKSYPAPPVDAAAPGAAPPATQPQQ